MRGSFGGWPELAPASASIVLGALPCACITLPAPMLVTRPLAGFFLDVSMEASGGVAELPLGRFCMSSKLPIAPEARAAAAVFSSSLCPLRHGFGCFTRSGESRYEVNYLDMRVTDIIVSGS